MGTDTGSATGKGLTENLPDAHKNKAAWEFLSRTAFDLTLCKCYCFD